MAEHNEIGKQGELLAQTYLAKQGYKIKHTNWRKYKCEVDIIAFHEEFLVFVEVKTRTSTEFGDPRDAVTAKKRRELLNAANYYIDDHPLNIEIQFDIVEVLLMPNQKPKINHISDAFNAVG